MPNCSPLWYLTCIFCVVVMMNFLLRKFVPTNANNCRLHSITSERIGNPELKAAIKCVHEYNNRAYIVIIILSIITAVLSFAGVPKLPWNIDTAMAGIAFMYIGILIKRYHIMEKLNGLGSVCKYGIYCILAVIWGFAMYFNPVDAVSFDNNSYGNYLLMLIAATAACFLVMMICKNIYDRFAGSQILKTPFNILAFYGTNTIFIMAFDYLAGDIGGSILRNYNSYKAYWPKKVVIMFAALIIFSSLKGFRNNKNESKLSNMGRYMR